MKSHIKWIQIFIFTLLHSVICQDVKGFVGESALLPCSSNSPKKAEVFWRDRDDGVLLDIRNDVEDLKHQHERFKGRVSSFPAEYRNMNYSIILKKLTLEDTGNYDCNVVIDENETTYRVKLEVREAVKIPENGVSSRRIVLPTLVLSALSLIISF